MKPLDPVTAKILFGIFHSGCRADEISPKRAAQSGPSVRMSKKMLARLLSAMHQIAPVDPPPVLPPPQPITPPEPPLPPMEIDGLDLV